MILLDLLITTVAWALAADNALAAFEPVAPRDDLRVFVTNWAQHRLVDPKDEGGGSSNVQIAGPLTVTLCCPGQQCCDSSLRTSMITRLVQQNRLTAVIGPCQAARIWWNNPCGAIASAIWEMIDHPGRTILASISIAAFGDIAPNATIACALCVWCELVQMLTSPVNRTSERH